MPRPHRIDFPGAIHHVGTRGNRRGAIVTDEPDRARFLSLVAEVCERYDLECGSWCLMTNHYHLILRSNAGEISRAMAMLNGRFARWTNARYNQDGHLFGKRFFNIVLEGQGHRLEVARYIPLNPVRAGLCDEPEDWRWSSFAAEIGRARRSELLSSFVIDDWFGGSSILFRSWVLAGGKSQKACLEVLFEAYDRNTAIRMAREIHTISIDEIADHLEISRSSLWRELLESAKSDKVLATTVPGTKMSNRLN